MKPTQIKGQLKPLCYPDDSRPSLQHIHNDGRHVVATDGTALVAIDLQLWPDLRAIGEPISCFPDWKNIIPSYDDERFALATTDLFRTPEEKIQHLEPEPKTCKECNGEGILDHECNCELCETAEVNCPDCDGAGKIVSPKPSPVVKLKINEYYPTKHKPNGEPITHQLFNARLVNKVIDIIEAMGFTDFEFCSGWSGQHQTRAMLIRQKGITCLIMPLNTCAADPSSPSTQSVKTIEPNYEPCQT